MYTHLDMMSSVVRWKGVEKTRKNGMTRPERAAAQKEWWIFVVVYWCPSLHSKYARIPAASRRDLTTILVDQR